MDSDEKSEVIQAQVEYNTPSSESSDAVTDARNITAVKGDESDGKVVWNFKTCVAACSLVGLYVGKYPPEISNTQN
jgi:hypothetical protein